MQCVTTETPRGSPGPQDQEMGQISHIVQKDHIKYSPGMCPDCVLE